MPDKKVKYIPVKEISSNQEAVLVEWNDGKALHRATIPVHSYGPEGPLSVDAEILSMGIPYGVPWEDVLEVNLKVSDLATLLRNAGIWTASDVMARSRELYGIIQSFYGIDVGALIMAASQYEEVKHG
jgi:hypothetical protein